MLVAGLMMAQVVAVAPLTSNDVAFRLAGRWPFAAYYPEYAQRRDLAGEVQARCVVGEDARLQACELLSVTPAGEGFDDSAKRLLPDVLVDRVAKDGQPTAGRSITFTIEYRAKGYRMGGPGQRTSVTFK